uniref:Vitellogenin-2 n=1 Tax=Neoseiulus barkeri TaxID=573039 RepID=A0A1Z2X6R5_9ACAR|nr:vitellogenin-2 [Neoseiulus barkeri]
MKVFFALAALVALAAAKHGGYHGDQEIVPDLFEGQREYVYNYRSLVATGLPRQSQRYSGLEKYGVLNVQVNEQQGNTKILGLRLRHVMSGSFDKEVEDIENRRIEGVSHSVEETIEKYGPVFVKIQDNEVQKLQAPENMPEEVINIYRGIAAIFTVGKPQTLEGDDHPFMPQEQRYGGEQQPIVYRRQEEGITGNFETIYEIFSNPEQYNQQLNLTKTRNYMKQMGPDGRMLQNGHDRRGCQNVCPTHKPEQLDKNMQPELSDWMKPTAEGCPVNFHPKTDLVEAFTTYNYNMTVEGQGKFALIHEAQALDKKILPLRKQQIKTVSLIKLQLIEVHPVTEQWNKQQATKSYDEITYRFPEGHQYDLQYLSLYNKGDTAEVLKDQIIPMIKALAQVIVSENIELKGQTGDKIVQLTMALGSLPKPELRSLWQVLGETATEKSATELQKVQRKVLIDTIGLSGSNNATELLLDLIMEQKLTTLETVDTLQTFQQNLVKPSMKVMQQLKSIVTDGKFQEKRTILGAASIAFAEIVRTNCATRTHKNTLHHQQQLHLSSQPGFRCGEEEYKQFVEAIRGQLHSAKNFAQLTIYIQTLGRLAHPKAVEALTPYVYGEQEVIGQLRQMHKDGSEDDSEYVQFIRQVAIYALHPAAQKHGAAVQPIVQGIYFDKQQDYELRIAALSVLLATQPTEATFGRIVLELGQEQDLEVASYAYSALNHLANSTLPCMQRTARRVQNVLGGLPDQTFGTHHSKWGSKTLYHHLTNLGMKGQWEVTQSNVSAIPRAAYFSITGNKGPFVSTVAEVSMITKGLENLYNFIHHKGGMTQIVENVMQRIRRDTRHAVGDQSVEQVLQQIEQAMQFNTEENNEEPRAVVSGSFLGNELYLPIDKEYMTKVGQKVGQQIVQLLSKEGADKTYHYVRILMPRTYVHVAPAVNGLPVVLSNRHPIVVSLSLKDLQTRFGAEKGQMKLNPFALAVSGLIKPTVYHTSIHSALTINPLQNTRYAHGVRAIEQTYVTLPIDASVQYTHQTKTLAFTLRPRFETVFFHKTRAMTFKTEALLIRGVEKPLLERYTVVKTQQKPFIFDRTLGKKLGMSIRVQGMSENEDYAVNFMKHQESFKRNPIASLIKQLSNEWFVPRAWTVRVEQNQQWPAQEMKMVIRLGKGLFQQRAQHQNGQQQQQEQQQRLTQEQLQKEQAHPEHMRMIAYEQEFEKITGRKPQTQELQQSLKQIAQKTEKFWSQVDRELSQQLQEQNTQVRSVEYILSAKGEKKSVNIHGHIIVAALPSKQARLAELKMKVDQKPISLEVQAVSAYTKTPQPFETEIREQEQRGILGFVAQLETRSTGKQQYTGKVEMNKSEEQKKLMTAPKEQKPWYYAQCEEDKKEQKSEMSTACEKVRVQKSALNKLRFEIELPQNIHQRLVNASHQIRETLKVRLYRNLRANYVAQQRSQENKIEGELVYSEQYPEMRMANLTIRTPDHEELRFERIALPKALRPSTMWTLKQQVKAALKLDRPEPVCVYNGQNLRTFDNVTVSLKNMKEGEKYIIARDNRQKPLFTILGEKKQAGQKSEIEIVLRDATLLKLTPPAQQNGAVYKVRVNSSSIEVQPKKTEVHQYGPKSKHMITLHVEEHKEGQDTLVIKVRDQRMRIVYDGKNLKIENGKQMLKGKLTGLCGDMNNQHIEELTGPEGCNYEREEDFVRSFALSKENHGLQGKWMCPEGVQPRSASSQDIQMHQQNKQMRQEYMQQRYQQRQNYRDQQEHMTQKTKMIPLNGKICFSTEPVTACQSGRRELETEMQSVEFVCLNQSHERTKQLQREVQTQKIASDLPYPGKSGLVHHEVEIPTRCGH